MPDGNRLTVVTVGNNCQSALWWRYPLRRMTFRRRERRMIGCHRWKPPLRAFLLIFRGISPILRAVMGSIGFTPDLDRPVT
jgi:hypothetical protein